MSVRDGSTVPVEDERVVDCGCAGGVPPAWVVAAALDVFFALDVDDQVQALEAVADRVRKDRA